MKKVLIIDSGSGGVNILAKCVKFCPNNNYLLFLDQKNLPYGEKSGEDLRRISREIIENTCKFFKPEIVVIGCNSLTSVAISFLRKCFPKITFIGSEPAIKPALRGFDKNEILVLATDVTIKNSKVLKRYKKICKSPKNLPKFIDENLFDRKKIEDYLKSALQNFNGKALVLGCTHFEGIKEELKKIFPDVKLFESGEGIAKRLKSFSNQKNEFQVQIMTSGDPKKLGLFYEYFSLTVAKEMQEG